MDVEVLGKTTLGEDMFMAIISSEDNIRNQKRIRETAKFVIPGLRQTSSAP